MFMIRRMSPRRSAERSRHWGRMKHNHCGGANLDPYAQGTLDFRPVLRSLSGIEEMRGWGWRLMANCALSGLDAVVAKKHRRLPCWRSCRTDGIRACA